MSDFERRRVAVLDIVGLTPRLLGPSTPRLSRWLAGRTLVPVRPQLPAVTCVAQATYITGEPPAGHGVVANGWHFRDRAETRFWAQSNHLVRARQLWDVARSADPGFRCASVFWFHTSMHSTVDAAVTHKTVTLAGGRKVADVYTRPHPLRGRLVDTLGPFPLRAYWGPGASIASTRWIAAAAAEIERAHAPHLSLVYLPHLDYCLQQHGPDAAAVQPELAALDEVCGELIDDYQRRGVEPILLSEYGITEVRRAAPLNRALRAAGLASVRQDASGEVLDEGESRAFAAVDHQAAHVYVRDPADLERTEDALRAVPGVADVLGRAGQRALGLDHPRSGELVALAEPDSWFSYFWWDRDELAPDYARTVAPPAKPGYDPLELFLDPAVPMVRARAGLAQLARRAGLRAVARVIPLDASLVRGSHGLAPPDREQAPVLATGVSGLLDGALDQAGWLPARSVFDVLLRALGLPRPHVGPAARS